MIPDTLEVHSNLRIYIYIMELFFKLLYLSETYANDKHSELRSWDEKSM